MPQTGPAMAGESDPLLRPCICVGLFGKYCPVWFQSPNTHHAWWLHMNWPLIASQSCGNGCPLTKLCVPRMCVPFSNSQWQLPTEPWHCLEGKVPSSLHDVIKQPTPRQAVISLACLLRQGVSSGNAETEKEWGDFETRGQIRSTHCCQMKRKEKYNERDRSGDKRWGFTSV